ncbi:MAG: hypothetical protein KAZ88_02380 [Acidimicrobiia bacterium]|nr:hypothetical protein [Acidimicrobiia bacterium]MBP8179822.1 hypothetical protein [Acidimicrobiia bacterium]
MRLPRRLLLLTLVALLGSQTVASAQPSRSDDNLGPNGEVPVDTVTDETIQAVADATGMSLEDARFAVGDGSRIILDFIQKHQADPEFGEVRVLNEGRFQAQIRTTTADSVLPTQLEDELGRPVKRFAGGLSAQDLDAELARAAEVRNRARSYPRRPAPN